MRGRKPPLTLSCFHSAHRRNLYRREVEVKGAKKPYHFISATAVGNRAFLLAVNANGRQVRLAEHDARCPSDVGAGQPTTKLLHA
jgi:hypothetical protein